MIRFMTRHRDQNINIATKDPKMAGYRFKQSPRICSGSTRIGSSVQYVPASLDEILTLQQCAAWLQQPEPQLYEMIQAGILKPLPFPSENYRLHARTVLLQLGVTDGALWRLAELRAPIPAAVKDDTFVLSRFSRFHCRLKDGMSPDKSAGFRSPDMEHSQSAKLFRSNRQNPPPTQPPKIISKRLVICYSYRTHGRLVEVTHMLGNRARQQRAESNVLDVVVNSIKFGSYL